MWHIELNINTFSQYYPSYSEGKNTFADSSFANEKIQGVGFAYL